MGKMNSLFKYAALLLTGLLFEQASALETNNIILDNDNLEKSFDINFYVWLTSLTILLVSFVGIMFLKWKESKKVAYSGNYNVRYNHVNTPKVDI